MRLNLDLVGCTDWAWAEPVVSSWSTSGRVAVPVVVGSVLVLSPWLCSPISKSATTYLSSFLTTESLSGSADMMTPTNVRQEWRPKTLYDTTTMRAFCRTELREGCPFSFASRARLITQQAQSLTRGLWAHPFLNNSLRPYVFRQWWSINTKKSYSDDRRAFESHWHPIQITYWLDSNVADASKSRQDSNQITLVVEPTHVLTWFKLSVCIHITVWLDSNCTEPLLHYSPPIQSHAQPMASQKRRNFDRDDIVHNEMPRRPTTL